ncbi:spo12 family domain-containing protein [Ditylenchus destructor]|nr:spo12 family domain-containing protein [Ditylenchus destructor]
MSDNSSTPENAEMDSYLANIKKSSSENNEQNEAANVENVAHSITDNLTSPTFTNKVQEKSVQGGCTPALTKVRQSKLEFKVQSPSDALMSPCTQLLVGGKVQNRRIAKMSHPQNLLRKKQYNDFSQKFSVDDEAENKE